MKHKIVRAKSGKKLHLAPRDVHLHVEVKTVDGRIYEEAIKYSKGTPNNPFTTEELNDKFKTLASALFSENRIDKILETITILEKLEDISALMGLLKEE